MNTRSTHDHPERHVPRPRSYALHVHEDQRSITSDDDGEAFDSSSENSTVVDDSTQSSASTSAHGGRSINFRSESGRATHTQQDIMAAWDALLQLANRLQQSANEFNLRNGANLELPWEDLVRDMVALAEGVSSTTLSVDTWPRSRSGSEFGSRSSYSSSDDATYRSESDAESERGPAVPRCGTQ